MRHCGTREVQYPVCARALLLRSLLGHKVESWWTRGECRQQTLKQCNLAPDPVFDPADGTTTYNTRAESFERVTVMAWPERGGPTPTTQDTAHRSDTDT